MLALLVEWFLCFTPNQWHIYTINDKRVCREMLSEREARHSGSLCVLHTYVDTYVSLFGNETRVRGGNMPSLIMHTLRLSPAKSFADTRVWVGHTHTHTYCLFMLQTANCILHHTAYDVGFADFSLHPPKPPPHTHSTSFLYLVRVIWNSCWPSFLPARCLHPLKAAWYAMWTELNRLQWCFTLAGLSSKDSALWGSMWLC